MYEYDWESQKSLAVLCSVFSVKGACSLIVHSFNLTILEAFALKGIWIMDSEYKINLSFWIFPLQYETP